MILEPYNITIIDLEKDDCSYVNDVIRVGESDYYRLTSKSYKLDKGYFVKCMHAPTSATYVTSLAIHVMSYGTFVRVHGTLFLEEELVNYYA